LALDPNRPPLLRIEDILSGRLPQYLLEEVCAMISVVDGERDLTLYWEWCNIYSEQYCQDFELTEMMIMKLHPEYKPLAMMIPDLLYVIRYTQDVLTVDHFGFVLEAFVCNH
jgi:hypothetical protein